MVLVLFGGLVAHEQPALGLVWHPGETKLLTDAVAATLVAEHPTLFTRISDSPLASAGDGPTEHDQDDEQQQPAPDAGEETTA